MGKHLVDPGNMVGGDGSKPRARRDHPARPDLRGRQHQLAAGVADPRQSRPAPADARRSAQDPHRGRAVDETGFPHRGTLQYVAPQIDPQTGTLYVRGILRNPDRTLLPGMFVNIRLPMGKVTQSALLVPELALQEDQGGRYLFVVGDDDVVQKRYVQLGIWRATSGGRPAASSRNDRVVIGELWRATPGIKVTPNLTTLGAVNNQRGSAPMISKFFIEHPVLANVLAIVLVVIGAVSLYPPAGVGISRTSCRRPFR